MSLDFAKLRSIFQEAVERQPADWPSLLDAACGDDAELRRGVEQLLEAHASGGSLLDNGPLATIEGVSERPGTQIGPYKLLQQIGEGGMGVVYMAEQTEPIARRVALKIIKPGMDSRQVIARFEAERQALALMDHVNIARVLDAGTTGEGARDWGLGTRGSGAQGLPSAPNPQPPVVERSPDRLVVERSSLVVERSPDRSTPPSQPWHGQETVPQQASLPPSPALTPSPSPSSGRPYFVMELVHGVPITKYCDDNRLTPRQRLELFVPVCQAIQHAHQKGIIHRDIKPSNVMVTLYDGQPVPKVIDFGVAKATEQKLTEQTLFTQYGTMVGTLEYMSPEQAEMSALGVDTRSDIYSLGVLLYELLTGSTPLSSKQMKEAAYAEILRLIKEEEPPKPSTRLSDSGEALASISAQRHMEPAKLTKLMRGELDWIVMKCLEKDRNRRYGTANGFAKDLQRYLADEPVLACPPSVGYRLRKFVRRNRGPVLAASLVVLALVAGIIGTTWGMIRAEQARREAVAAQFAEAERADGERRAKEEVQTRLAQIEKGTEILASVFRDLDPMAAENEGVTLRVLLVRRLGEAARQLEGEVVGDPLVVARLQHVLGISLHELGHREQAEGLLVKAGQTRQRLLGADHLDTVATKHHLAVLYRDQGEYAMAETLFKEVLAVRTARLGTEHLDTLTSQHYLALLYNSQRKHALAETLLKEVLAIRTAKLGADNPDTLTSQHRLAGVYRSQAKYALSEALHKEVLAIRTSKLGADHLDTVATKGGLAGLYRVQGRYALAETLCKEVLAVRTAKLGADHPDTLGIQFELARVYRVQEKYALSETLLKEVLAIRTAKLGADHPDTLNSQSDLVSLYVAQGKTALAEKLYKEVLAVRIAKLGADHPDTLTSQHHLALLYWSMKKFDLSIPLLEETLKLRKAKLGPDHPNTLDAQADLGVIYCDAGRFADAIPLLEEVHQKGRKEPGLPVGNYLLNAYVGAGKTAEWIALVTEQVRAAREQFSADSSPLTDALADAGQALLDAKAYDDAEPLLREVLSFREKTAGTFWATHHTRSLLGGVLFGQEKYAAAEPLLLQGYAGLKEREATIPSEVKGYPTQALERLVQLYDAWGKPEEAAKWRKELEAHRKAAENSVKPKEK